MSLRVLTWNLKHGRAVPSAGRDLFEEFLAALARWDWDVALLQEVPPWWPPAFGGRLPADWRLALTSRNLGLPLRRAVATRRPDLIKSNGGGCNAVLVRGAGVGDASPGVGGASPGVGRGASPGVGRGAGVGRASPGSITEHRTLRLARVPERRWLLGVQLSGPSEMWVGNVHLTGSRRREIATGEARAAAAAMLHWAGGAPIVLGGDFNLRSLSLPRYTHAGGFEVDHIFVRGRRPASPEPDVLDRGPLSDHAPVRVTVTG